MTAEPERKPWTAMKHPTEPGWMVYEEAPGIEPAVIIARGLTEANARLISSAPELLEALEHASCLLDAIADDPEFPEWRESKIYIRKVIARAEPGK